MSKKKAKEKNFRVVVNPTDETGYLVQTKDGETLCSAVTRSGFGLTKHEMRAANWRLLHMAYVEDETGDPRAGGEFWVREEYAHRVPCW